jgi:hypothetical protein
MGQTQKISKEAEILLKKEKSEMGRQKQSVEKKGIPKQTELDPKEDAKTESESETEKIIKDLLEIVVQDVIYAKEDSAVAVANPRSSSLKRFFQAPKHFVQVRLGSVAGPVIQATGRSEFEDGLGSIG